MNRRGQSGKIIMTFGAIISVVLVIGILLVLSAFAFGIKQPEIPSQLESAEILEDSVLFKMIEVNGEKMTLLHGLMKADINSRKIQNIADLSFEEREKYLNFMARVKDGVIESLASESESKEMCFILCQTCNTETGFTPYNLMKISPNEEDFVFRFEDGGLAGSPGELAATTEFYSIAGLDNRISFSITESGKEREFNIVYYYGECYNSEALLELVEGKNE